MLGAPVGNKSEFPRDSVHGSPPTIVFSPAYPLVSSSWADLERYPLTQTRTRTRASFSQRGNTCVWFPLSSLSFFLSKVMLILRLRLSFPPTKEPEGWATGSIEE